MSKRRVFVVWTHPLFRDSVRLLLNHADIEWVGESVDLTAARGLITDLRPDTVLIEEQESELPANVLALMEDCPWALRVIGLSLAGNQSHIYHREQRTVAKADDLLRLVLE